mmetsp:Transcript_66396/g.151932  ORF Transcript_66396/g.151932 Transcript_66396/m.151932 type:complete len:214 (-) Transcript_66396:4-645(-)
MGSVNPISSKPPGDHEVPNTQCQPVKFLIRQAHHQHTQRVTVRRGEPAIRYIFWAVPRPNSAIDPPSTADVVHINNIALAELHADVVVGWGHKVRLCFGLGNRSWARRRFGQLVRKIPTNFGGLRLLFGVHPHLENDTVPGFHVANVTLVHKNIPLVHLIRLVTRNKPKTIWNVERLDHATILDHSLLWTQLLLTAALPWGRHAAAWLRFPAN